MEEIKRGPGRPKRIIEDGHVNNSVDTMRPEMRPDDLRATDPQEAARIRAAQVLAQLGDSLGEEDKFFIPEELKDPSWDIQWKRFSVYNAEDHGYLSSLQRTGWEFVPARRPGFERFVPRNWKDDFILKEGMVLMERPKEVSNIIEGRQLGQARERIRIAEQKNGQSPPGTLPRDNSGRPIAANGVAGVRRTIGPVAD
jgi:hypothetical protein